MKIFAVLSAMATAGVRGSQIWLRNLYEPLLDLGHSVYLFRAEEGVVARNRKDASLKSTFSQKLIDAFKKSIPANHSIFSFLT